MFFFKFSKLKKSRGFSKKATEYVQSKLIDHFEALNAKFGHHWSIQAGYKFREN